MHHGLGHSVINPIQVQQKLRVAFGQQFRVCHQWLPVYGWEKPLTGGSLLFPSHIHNLFRPLYPISYHLLKQQTEQLLCKCRVGPCIDFSVNLKFCIKNLAYSCGPPGKLASVPKFSVYILLLLSVTLASVFATCPLTYNETSMKNNEVIQAFAMGDSISNNNCCSLGDFIIEAKQLQILFSKYWDPNLFDKVLHLPGTFYLRFYHFVSLIIFLLPLY